MLRKEEIEFMNKAKIAFGGGRTLGVKTLEWLCTQDYLKVVAVCPIPKRLDLHVYDDIKSVAERNNLRVCEISDLMSLDIDIGLSVNYHRIINEDILCHCKRGFYNVHHSYNLRLRGRNITTHAILNTHRENIFYHGTTLHKMVPQLDAGPIVASRSVEITNDDTAYTLFQKTDSQALSMIKEWMPRLSSQKVFLYDPPVEGVHFYRTDDLPSRMLNVSEMSCIDLDSYIRAFDFPNKEPAFIEKNGMRIHLVFRMRDEYKYEYNLNGRIYYTNIC